MMRFPKTRIVYVSSDPPASPEAGVCTVMGWMGSSNASVAKYSAIYERLGLKTLRFTCPTRRLLRGRAALDVLATDVLEVLTSASPKGPLYFHSLSNGGTMVYLALSRLLSGDLRYAPLRSRIGGAVFDSAPARIHATSALKAFARATPFPAINRIAARFSDAVAPATRIVDFFYTKTSLPSRIVGEAAEDPMTCPQLYLYSTGDTITDHGPIDDLVAARRKRGIAVSAVRWDDSEHVMHLMAHRREYREAIARFVRGERG